MGQANKLELSRFKIWYDQLWKICIQLYYEGNIDISLGQEVETSFRFVTVSLSYKFRIKAFGEKVNTPQAFKVLFCTLNCYISYKYNEW